MTLPSADVGPEVPNIVEAIGRTPLVRLRGIPSAPGLLFGKLELLNPFGMKDRAARCIILEAHRSGELHEGAPIVESSSGTMALGVALVGRALGHPVHIVTDPRIDAITLAKLNALGCVVHIVDQMSQQGWQSARLERLAELLSELPGAYWTRQYENVGNPLGYVELADELLAQLDRIDVLVGPVGSGGSLCGTARQLRARGMRPRVVGVDAVGSVIFGQPDRPGRLQSGLGNSLIAPNVDFAVIDEVHWLSDAEAFQATHELAHREQIFAGNSSGSAYLVARWLSLDAPPGTRIVALLPDRGDRYAATLYNPDYLRKHDLHLPVELPASPKDADLDTPVSEWSRAHLRAPAAV